MLALGLTVSPKFNFQRSAAVYEGNMRLLSRGKPSVMMMLPEALYSRVRSWVEGDDWRPGSHGASRKLHDGVG